MKNSSMRVTTALALVCSFAALLVACGGGGGSGDGPAPAPVLSVFAGSLQSAGNRDGVGIAAQFRQPQGVAQDAAGTVYVADTGNHTIRKISTQGAVTTFAGAAGQAGSADGTGATARFSSPHGLALDAAGNLYVADTGNHTVRRIDSNGVVTTVAGVAGAAGSTDGSQAVARLSAPVRVAVARSGVVYVLSDAQVRKLTPDGSVSTFPVQPSPSTPFLRLSGIAVDAAGNVFVADFPSTGSVVVSGGGSIRKFDPQGMPLPLGGAADGGRRFNLPTDIAVDAGGNLYVIQNGIFVGGPSFVFYYRNVLRIAPDGSVALLAGSASEGAEAMTVDGAAGVSRLADPRAIAAGPGGRVVMVDTATHAVRVLDAQGTLSTLAGGDGSGYRDGAGLEARFSAPRGVAAAADGSLLVVDSGNASLRRVSPAGVVSTVRAPSTLSSPADLAVGANGSVYVTEYRRPGSMCFTPTPYLVVQLADGPSPFSVSYNGSESARAVTTDAKGNVVVNERAAVIPGYCGTEYGLPTQISAIAADGSKRVLASGIEARALAADATGRVYFATAQGTVGSVAADGEVEVRAGTAGQPGDQDGVGADARFRALTALAVDGSGNLYVGDGTRIRRVTPGGAVTTIADLSTLDGAQAATQSISGLAWVSGALYASLRNAIVRIAPVN